MMLVGVRGGRRPVQRQRLRRLSREDSIVSCRHSSTDGALTKQRSCAGAHTLGPLSDRNPRLCVTMWPNNGKMELLVEVRGRVSAQGGLR